MPNLEVTQSDKVCCSIIREQVELLARELSPDGRKMLALELMRLLRPEIDSMRKEADHAR